MLHELEVLETRRIAELAGKLQKLRDRLLQGVGEAQLGESPPARGEHNPAAALDLRPILADAAAFVQLREAIATLPRDIRDKVWMVAQLGAARFDSGGIADALAEAAGMSDAALLDSLLDEPDLATALGRGLYQLGSG